MKKLLKSAIVALAISTIGIATSCSPDRVKVGLKSYEGETVGDRLQTMKDTCKKYQSEGYLFDEEATAKKGAHYVNDLYGYTYDTLVFVKDKEGK